MQKERRIPAIFVFIIFFTVMILPVNVFADEQEDSAAAPEEQSGLLPEDTEMGGDPEDGILYEEQSGETTYDMTYDSGAEEEVVYSRGRILRILSEKDSEVDYSGGKIKTNTQVVEVLVIKGPHKGEKVAASSELNLTFGERYKSIVLEPGDEVFLDIEENADGSVSQTYVVEIARDKYLLYLGIGFLIILILIGRVKGLKAIISLALTVICVLKILLPAILNGWDPITVSVGICIVVICVTMLIISGFNRKTFSAVMGTVGGVLVAGIIALIIGTMAKLTGFGDEDSQMLLYIPQNIQIDFRGLLFSGIIIGTMGATMDVGMSIASAMHEIKTNCPEIKTVDLMKAGMNVGRDTMATMANTLILAYAGGSLHLMLLMMAHSTPFSDIINWDLIASEVLRAIAGSIGIVFAIPLTALATGLVEEYDKREKRNGGVDYRY